MSESFKFDVFLSHSQADKALMQDLAHRLKRDGLKVWFEDWEIVAGNPVEHVIQQGLDASRVLVMAMSQNAFASEWPALESRTFRFRNPTDKARRFIPLRLDSAEIKNSIRHFSYIDWRKQSSDQYARLVAACKLPSPSIEAASSSVQGTILKVFSGHTNKVLGVAITPDGKWGISGSHDKTVRVWNLSTWSEAYTLKGHDREVIGVAISADGKRAVSGSWDGSLKVWDLTTGELVSTLLGHEGNVVYVSITPDGSRVVSSSVDNTIRLWDANTGSLVATLSSEKSSGKGIAISDDGKRAISGSTKGSIYLWDLESAEIITTLEGHKGQVSGLAMNSSGTLAFSGSPDRTTRLWDLDSGTPIATLEGHTGAVYGVSMTPDGRRAISASDDKTLRVWDLDSGKAVTTLSGHQKEVYGVAITTDGLRAISSSADETVRVWRLPPITADSTEKVTRYTNAKVLLVGESGVGKTGLAYRLTEDCFRDSVSTDAAWATQLRLPNTLPSERIEREIWLWDFAGQADYRLIHQLYMDETALAVLVFNPQSENPFEGLGQWDRDLQRAARRPFRKLLVAGRIDRGGLMISRAAVERFRQERNFGEYIETSALLGGGCDALRNAIVSHIPWRDIPWTASPRIFRLLKDEIVKLKDEGNVLLRISELKQQLEMRLPEETFSTAQLRAVVGLLVGPGVLWLLEFGDFVLLQPERVNSYAAAVIRKVRLHTEEIGCIAEEEVLVGNLDYQDMKRLPVAEEEIVLRAMHQTFVDHGLCLREHTNKGTLLIFPSYFKRERPELEGHPLVLVTYKFSGPLDEIYATLIVRLHHTDAFERDRLWRFAADFKTPAGKRLGLKMTKRGEGTAELEVYFELGISNDVQVTFIRYVHEHLKLKALDVVRLRHYVCERCQTPVEGQRAIEVRIAKGFKDIFCGACGEEVRLWDLIEEKFASEEFQQRVRELEVQAKVSIDNESRELILTGHSYVIAGEAGQIFRQYSNSDHGIDGEIEFKDYVGNASGKRLYLQLKSGDSYLYKRKRDGAEIFIIKKGRWAQYWVQQAYPVMLVIRTSDGEIRWMNVTDYLRERNTDKNQIVFDGEPFTALNLIGVRDRVLADTI